MTVFSSSGTVQDTVTATTHDQLIASVGQYTMLARVDVQGYINLPNILATVSPGPPPNYNMQAGIQWVPAGTACPPLAAGNTSQGNFLSFAEAIPPSLANEWFPSGTTTEITQTGFALDLHWRGLFRAPQAIDIYMSVGSDVNLSPSTQFRAMYSWHTQYASFP